MRLTNLNAATSGGLGLLEGAVEVFPEFASGVVGGVQEGNGGRVSVARPGTAPVPATAADGGDGEEQGVVKEIPDTSLHYSLHDL